MEDLNGDRLLPVFVYLHGGINNGNGSQYGAEYMMDEDIVLVFVHFRLHVFGNFHAAQTFISKINYN